MRRRVLLVASAVSLLLCGTAIVLWVQTSGYQRSDKIDRSWLDSGISLGSTGGKLFVYYISSSNPWWPDEQWSWVHETGIVSFTPTPPVPTVAGIGYLRTRGVANGSGPYVLTWLILPYWLIAAIFLLPPLLSIRSIIRARRLSKRRAAGLCPGCGYDLRATTGRCPECGDPIVDSQSRVLC